MKGKSTFTTAEIVELRKLVRDRIGADPAKQKAIRAQMREIGFYGKDDFGLVNLRPYDFEMLIQTGRMEIRRQAKKSSKSKASASNRAKSTASKANLDFRLFDPLNDDPQSIPNVSGNYLICLKKGSHLPPIQEEYRTTIYKGLEVVYTGISKMSLRGRDYRQHFTGNNAGRSTLRKSLGSLMGFKKVPRDKDPSTGKTKFREGDEVKLSQWMMENLVLFYATTRNPGKQEEDLINKFNPPLNLSKNKNKVNHPYRKVLSKLRRT